MNERSWRGWAWLVLAAALLHNLEEGLTYAYVRERDKDRWFGDMFVDPQVFHIALLIVSLAAIVAVVYGVRTNNPIFPGIVAAVMFVNVFLPHVAMAIISGGYATGVATAVLLNLPICGYFLLRMRKKLGTAGMAWWFLAAVGLIALLPLMWLFGG